MTRNEKLVGSLAILFALSRSSKKKKQASPPSTPKAPSPQPSKKKSSPPSPGRPDSTKDEPEEEPTTAPSQEPEIDDPTVTLRERLKLQQEQEKAKAKKDKGKGKPRPPTAKQKPKPKPRSKEQQKKADDQALRLAEQMHDFYIERGELPEVAAADTMTLYILAGGQDRQQIRGYQKLMGVEPTGQYDKPTREQVLALLDPAVDRACSTYIILIENGEDPRYAAAEALATYIIEQRKDPDHIPLVPERVAALQMQFMAVPTGQYDQDTQNALVQFGVVPP